MYSSQCATHKYSRKLREPTQQSNTENIIGENSNSQTQGRERGMGRGRAAGKTNQTGRNESRPHQKKKRLDEVSCLGVPEVVRRGPLVQHRQLLAQPLGEHVRPGAAPLAPLDESRPAHPDGSRQSSVPHLTDTWFFFCRLFSSHYWSGICRINTWLPDHPRGRDRGCS